MSISREKSPSFTFESELYGPDATESIKAGLTTIKHFDENLKVDVLAKGIWYPEYTSASGTQYAEHTALSGILIAPITDGEPPETLPTSSNIPHDAENTDSAPVSAIGRTQAFYFPDSATTVIAECAYFDNDKVSPTQLESFRLWQAYEALLCTRFPDTQCLATTLTGDATQREVTQKIVEGLGYTTEDGESYEKIIPPLAAFDTDLEDSYAKTIPSSSLLDKTLKRA